MEPGERETTFRFDHEERVLWAETADEATSRRWTKRGLAVTPAGLDATRQPRTWRVKLPANLPAWRDAWRGCFLAAVPGWPSYASGLPVEPSAEDE